MTDVLVLQNSRIEGPGILGNLLESDGFTIRTIYAKHESTKRNFRMVIIILINSAKKSLMIETLKR